MFRDGYPSIISMAITNTILFNLIIKPCGSEKQINKSQISILILNIQPTLIIKNNYSNHSNLPNITMVLTKLKNIITSLDKNPAEPQLTYGGLSAKKNIVGGLVGLGFLILTIILIITKSIGVINREKLVLSSFNQRDLSQLALQWYDVSFALQQKVSDTEIRYIDLEEYPSLGVEAFVWQVYVDTKGIHPARITPYPLQPCFSQIAKWMLCARNSTFNLTYKLKCNEGAIDGGVCHEIQQYFISIAICDPNNPKCNKTVAKNLFPVLLISDTKFDVFNIKTSEIFQKNSVMVNDFQTIYLSRAYNVQWTIPVSKLIVETDQSILPKTIDAFSSINVTQTHFIPTQSILLNQHLHFPFLMIFNLIRSGFTQSYSRSFGRFDEMLGEIFGLVGLISLIAACFCSGYNKWAIKKYIDENIKKPKNDEETPDDEQPSQQQKSGNLVQYLKQTIQICKKKPQRTSEIDLLQLQNDVQTIKQLIGLQKFQKISDTLKSESQQNKIQSQSSPTITDRLPNTSTLNERDMLTEQLVGSKYTDEEEQVPRQKSRQIK